MPCDQPAPVRSTLPTAITRADDRRTAVALSQ